MKEKIYEVYEPYTGTVHFTSTDPDKALIFAQAHALQIRSVPQSQCDRPTKEPRK